MGSPQFWGSILTLFIISFTWIVKKIIDRGFSKKTMELNSRFQQMLEQQKFLANQYSEIAEYVKEQSMGLIRAYFRLYKSKEGEDASDKDFYKFNC